MNNAISAQLYGAIRRSFGSIRDMRRAIENAQQRQVGKVFLVALNNESLQVVCAIDRPLGTVLMRAGEDCSSSTLSERYAAFMAHRPNYPYP